MKKNTFLTPDNLRKSILELIASSETSLTKNQIARQLGIRGDNRIILKKVLAQLEADGKLDRGARRRFVPTNPSLAAGHVLVVEVIAIGEDAQSIAIPLDWTAETPPPKIELLPSRRTHTKHGHLDIGAHVLVRLHSHTKDLWHGEVLKKLEKTVKVHLGIFTPTRDGGGRLSPCHRKDTFPGIKLLPGESKDLKEGDIVAYSVATAFGHKIHKKIGRIDDPKSFSQMAIYAHNIPHTFSKEALSLSEQGKIPPLGQRTDFRDIPLVTIDGEDARDFDDAVWASSDHDPRNPGGWRILVAIADVAYYVRPGDALDHTARERGNSVYFPDCVVPMLPEALSNELCSLKPNVDRACMAIEMIVTSEGKVKAHQVKRGLMRSKARLTYLQVQRALDGDVDEVTRPLLETVIKPLYGAYKAFIKARAHRGTLDIDQQERKVIFGSNGHIERIIPSPRYDSHRLIEEFMIAANVAAARTLLAKKWPCLYRIHDAPDALRVVNLRQILRKMKIAFTKTMKPNPRQFNDVLTKTKGTPFAQMVTDLVLRSQAQARYSPLNIGHFGLSLTHYAHFTSPIRRYSDLIVHRSLISALQFGDDGLPDRSAHLTTLADHISATERTAAHAEREVLDRFVIAYHVPHVGEVFPATIVGVTKTGLFAAITATGAQGFIPRHLLKGDTFYHDESNHRLVGRRTQTSYQLGGTIEVRIQAANISTNSLLLEIPDHFEGAKKPPVRHEEKTPNKHFKKLKKTRRKR